MSVAGQQILKYGVKSSRNLCIYVWDYAFNKLCPQMTQNFADEKTNPGEISCVSPPPAFAARHGAAPARRRLCLRSYQFSTDFFQNHDFIGISANSSWK
jgi:hypothetical protein